MRADEHIQSYVILPHVADIFAQPLHKWVGRAVSVPAEITVITVKHKKVPLEINEH